MIFFRFVCCPQCSTFRQDQSCAIGLLFGKPYPLFWYDEHIAMVRVSKKRLDTAVQRCREFHSSPSLLIWTLFAQRIVWLTTCFSDSRFRWAEDSSYVMYVEGCVNHFLGIFIYPKATHLVSRLTYRNLYVWLGVTWTSPAYTTRWDRTWEAAILCI